MGRDGKLCEEHAEGAGECMKELKQKLRQRLTETINYRDQMGDEELAELIDREIFAASDAGYISLAERMKLQKELFDSFRRLDILQGLVEDPEITEIMVNGTDAVFVERRGRVERWEHAFESKEQLLDLIRQIAGKVNRTVNTASPIADARLEDGSRVHMVLEPVALDGPVLTIRKFPEVITMERLLEYGSVTEEAAAFLRSAVSARYNIFVSGGTGAGKTTFLNALSEFIPADERVITIEDSAELQLRHIENLVRLETREAGAEGGGGIGIGDLIRASLRMRPDRIIIGEVRGKEAMDLLQAMNTGHDGSFSTGHGNSPKDMLARLETMVLMGADIPLGAVRSQIASAIDIMIHVARMRDKSRKVVAIEEVDRYENGEIILHPLFMYSGTLEKAGDLRHREKLRISGTEL